MVKWESRLLLVLCLFAALKSLYYEAAIRSFDNWQIVSIIEIHAFDIYTLSGSILPVIGWLFVCIINISTHDDGVDGTQEGYADYLTKWDPS